jgi:hypothetical protein
MLQPRDNLGFPLELLPQPQQGTAIQAGLRN